MGLCISKRSKSSGTSWRLGFSRHGSTIAAKDACGIGYSGDFTRRLVKCPSLAIHAGVIGTIINDWYARGWYQIGTARSLGIVKGIVQVVRCQLKGKIVSSRWQRHFSSCVNEILLGGQDELFNKSVIGPNNGPRLL
jgi:hypothetical protein